MLTYEAHFFYGQEQIHVLTISNKGGGGTSHLILFNRDVILKMFKIPTQKPHTCIFLMIIIYAFTKLLDKCLGGHSHPLHCTIWRLSWKWFISPPISQLPYILDGHDKIHWLTCRKSAQGHPRPSSLYKFKLYWILIRSPSLNYIYP